MSLSLAERPAAARPATIEVELNYLGPVCQCYS